MTYSPQNKTVFTAAYSGALGGIGAALKTPTDPVPTDPGVVSIADVAGAFAQSFDTVWGAVTPSELDVLSIEEVSAAYFIGSAPPNAPPFNVPANWTGVCEALVAIVKAGENYFASQGITPNPWGGGSTGGIVQTTFVWKPGATPGGNVYSSWTALMAAAAGVPGVKFMTIDPTAPGFVNFTVDPGTWNLDEFRISLADDASSNVLRIHHLSRQRVLHRAHALLRLGSLARLGKYHQLRVQDPERTVHALGIHRGGTQLLGG